MKISKLSSIHSEMRGFSEGQGRCPHFIGIKFGGAGIHTVSYFEDDNLSLLTNPAQRERRVWGKEPLSDNP
jgi:hypothetical protein